MVRDVTCIKIHTLHIGIRTWRRCNFSTPLSDNVTNDMDDVTDFFGVSNELQSLRVFRHVDPSDENYCLCDQTAMQVGVTPWVAETNVHKNSFHTCVMRNGNDSRLQVPVCETCRVTRRVTCTIIHFIPKRTEPC